MQKELEPRRDIDGVAVWCGFDEILPIATLKPHPKTNNSHPPRQLELHSKIIIITGNREVIVVSTRSGCITKGHGRMEAATLAGLSAAPVEYQYDVELVERAIRNSSRSGDIVSDWFSGSGTSLIACETTGRKARLMELDPVYCDVIVQRWEKFTGKKATRA